MSMYIRQNHFTLRIVTAIYFLPVSYNQTTQRFVQQRTNLVSFGVGILLSFTFFYHDIFIQNVFFANLPPFAFAIVLLELLLYTIVPFCVVLNNLFYRKRWTDLLNVLFADDSVLDTTNVTMSGAYFLYISVLSILLVTLELCNLFALETLSHKMLTTTFVLRYTGMIHFLYLFHMCVSMVGLRMEQLKMLFHHKQTEDEFEYFLGLFMAKFERYVMLIEQINRCFSLPIVTMLALGMVELAYLVFECFYTYDAGSPDTEMYNGFTDRAFSQFWQSMYCHFLVLTVSSCERTRKMVEETALCTRHFDDYRLQNTRAAKQIQKFLLKNLHQKKKFSACGFFDIDNTVIYMVFSSIVTYLVILIQFKQLETDLTQAGDGYNVTSNVSTVQP
uniref:Gustatory receptor n=1 Tax=Anopheles coluzzii TaxID=1518534 RepID=A0A6E8VYQ5_ANOCL